MEGQETAELVVVWRSKVEVATTEVLNKDKTPKALHRVSK